MYDLLAASGSQRRTHNTPTLLPETNGYVGDNGDDGLKRIAFSSPAVTGRRSVDVCARSVSSASASVSTGDGYRLQSPDLQRRENIQMCAVGF